MDERRPPLNNWPLHDPQLMLAIAVCLVAITFVLVIALLRTRVRRAEFARLQRTVEEMSERVKELQAAEQLRFLKEINAPEKDDDRPSIIPSFLKTA
jgi:hypothetical protein